MAKHQVSNSKSSRQRIRPELYNGQVWKQNGFPYCKIVVLMGGQINGELMFCKAGIGDWRCRPLIMSEESGRWLYSRDELLTRLRELGFAPIGNGHIVVVPDQQEGATDGTSA